MYMWCTCSVLMVVRLPQRVQSSDVVLYMLLRQTGFARSTARITSRFWRTSDALIWACRSKMRDAEKKKEDSESQPEEFGGGL
jgi:hypothetical protein